MGRKSVRVRVAKEWETIAKEIRDEIRSSRKSNNYEISDLTYDTIILMQELKRRFNRKNVQ